NPEVGIHHLHEGKHAAGCEAADLFGVAQFAGSERVIPEAVAILEQQDTLCIKAVESILPGIHPFRAIPAGEQEAVLEQFQFVRTPEVEWKRQQQDVEVTCKKLLVNALRSVLGKK